MYYKIITAVFCLILTTSFVRAEINAENFYRFNENFEVEFVKLSKAEINNNLDKESKNTYKNLAKNEKYMEKGKYNKAENLLPDFLPNAVRLTNIYADKFRYPLAISYAQKVVELDKDNKLSKFAKDYKLGSLYSLSGDYLNSNKYLLPYVSENKTAAFLVAKNYFYMQDLNTAETYARQVKENSESYYAAQDLLYTLYNIKKDSGKAYTAASELIKLDPGNPENYMKLASVTTNNLEKLRNYYRAKQIFYSCNLSSMIVNINNLTAPLEQQKIDEAYRKITVYCKKPDWNKIKTRNKGLLEGDISYWDERQQNFFEEANDCIKRYKGNNLAACFNDINSVQENLDKELAAENARRIEAEQREAQIRLLVRQNALLEEQNRLDWARYNYYYPRYYRRGYWW